MSDPTINLIIQRWVYERGNYQIIVENAWSLRPLFSQERITTNGEFVRDRIEANTAVLFWRTVFEDTILVPGDELGLKVQWKSGIMTSKARLLIDQKPEDWTEYKTGKWAGQKGEWPSELEYESW